VCFQETHSNNNIEKYWEDEWGNKCVFSHHDSKSAGVCVMFKKGLDFVIHNSEIDRNGRYIILDITIHTQRLTFVCLYGYNTNEPSLFNIILQKVLTLKIIAEWSVLYPGIILVYFISEYRSSETKK
jgi:hypothetical protein